MCQKRYRRRFGMQVWRRKSPEGREFEAAFRHSTTGITLSVYQAVNGYPFVTVFYFP